MDRNHNKTQEDVMEDSDNVDFVLVEAQKRQEFLVRTGWNIGCIEGILISIEYLMLFVLRGYKY